MMYSEIRGRDLSVPHGISMRLAAAMAEPRPLRRRRPLESDVQYFGRRAVQERRAADRAAGPEAHAIHRELAQRYARLSRQPTRRPPLAAERKRREDDLLDEALSETFPASDPVSVDLS